MTSTVEDLRTLDGKINWVGVARLAAMIMPIIGAAAGLTYKAAVSAATGDAKDGQQRVKNKAEGGYQLTRNELDAHATELLALRSRVLALEQAAARPVVKKGVKPVRKPPPAAFRPKSLPSDLDKAEKQVYLKVVPPLAPAAAQPHVDASP
jgi:hypothetical protein